MSKRGELAKYIDWALENTEDVYEEEPKHCRDCCHFARSMDDLYQDRGVCAFSKSIEEHDEDMECYYPEEYERCHW